MTSPNRIFGHYTADACVADEPIFSPVQPEELVCRADSFSSAPVLTSTPRPSPSSIFESRVAQQLADSLRARSHASRTSVVASAFGHTGTPRVTNPSEGLAYSPLAVANLAACSNAEGPIDDIPDDPPEDPPTDDPPVQTGGENGGLGAGIQATFATGSCRNPTDLDLASAAGSVFLTCSDTSGDGQGLIEILSGSSVTARHLPTSLGGDSNKPIRLSSSAAGDSGVIYAGFTTARSVAELEGESGVNGIVPSLLNSGIYTTNEAGTGTVALTSFNALEWSGFNISLAGFGGGDTTVERIQPNSPVSMLRMGERVIVVNNNRQVNPVGGALDFAPITVHRYTINPSTGALVPESAGAEFANIVNAGTSQTGNAAMLMGYYNATASGSIDANRFGVVVQGLPGLGVDTSGIHIFNAADLTAGVPSEPGRTGSFISFGAAPDPESPDVTFAASNATSLPVVRNRFALVGSLDGRVAIVDCDTNPVAEGESRVRYVRAFESGAIENIVVHPDGDFAYVIGRGAGGARTVRALTLAEGPNFGRVGEEFPFFTAPSPSGDDAVVSQAFPAIYANDSVLAAHDRAYAKAPISLP